MSVSRRELKAFKVSIRREVELTADGLRRELALMTASLSERSQASKEAVQLALASVIRPEDKEGSKTGLLITSIIAVIGVLVTIVMVFKK